jgi:hypothetical protein
MSPRRQDRVIEAGASQGAIVKLHSLPLAPIAGAFCIVAGVVLIIAGTKTESDAANKS